MLLLSDSDEKKNSKLKLYNYCKLIRTLILMKLIKGQKEEKKIKKKDPPNFS